MTWKKQGLLLSARKSALSLFHFILTEMLVKHLVNKIMYLILYAFCVVLF